MEGRTSKLVDQSSSNKECVYREVIFCFYTYRECSPRVGDAGKDRISLQRKGLCG